jgi:hypothetical protein
MGSGGGGDEDEEVAENNDEDVFEGLRINGQPMSADNPIEIYETGSDELVAQIHWHGESGEWHYAPLIVPLGQRQLYDIRILDPDLEEIPSGDGTEFQFEITTTEETPEGLLTAETFNGLAAIEGTEEGNGELVVHILSDGERIWSSPPLMFEIGTAE